MKKTKKKLYAYVDESGQDTKGLVFVVSVLILEKEREEISEELEKIGNYGVTKTITVNDENLKVFDTRAYSSTMDRRCPLHGRSTWIHGDSKFEFGSFLHGGV